MPVLTATDQERVILDAATLEYTTDDDGIWIKWEKRRKNLGFWPTPNDVLDAVSYWARGHE